MGKNALLVFRSVYKRMYMEENYKRRGAICARRENEDEELAWRLCKRFWPIENAEELPNVDRIKPNPELSDADVMDCSRKLSELLDRLGWARLPE